MIQAWFTRAQAKKRPKSPRTAKRISPTDGAVELHGVVVRRVIAFTRALEEMRVRRAVVPNGCHSERSEESALEQRDPSLRSG
jgi:hypothetical protein